VVFFRPGIEPTAGGTEVAPLRSRVRDSKEVGVSVRSSIQSGWEGLRESYWFLPMLMAAAAAALALGILQIDRSLSGSWARRLDWIRDAGPDGTRAVLVAIAGSMITVTGVVFSVTIVALTLASSQFGPRLLRNFLRDRANQLVLGTLVATFLYSLLVLRAVGPEGSVPHLATAIAMLLAIVSLFVLIYFIHHAASSIQASSIIDAVACEIDEKLPALFPEQLGDEAPRAADLGAALHALAADGVEVRSEGAGYLRILDADAVMTLACEHGLVICLHRRPGDFVAAGASLARSGPLSQTTESVQAAIRAAFVLGPRRTPAQDLDFLTDQLTEMAVRALSPGVNDPQTAVACVHRLGSLIGNLSERAMPSAERVDEAGCLRVVAPATRFDGVVARCLDPIRRYGASNPEVVVSVLAALGEVSRRSLSPERGRVLGEHAAEFYEAFARCAESKRDLAQVQKVYEPLMARLARGPHAV
jgi:uncharacterized membrane protein